MSFPAIEELVCSVCAMRHFRGNCQPLVISESKPFLDKLRKVSCVDQQSFPGTVPGSVQELFLKNGLILDFNGVNLDENKMTVCNTCFSSVQRRKLPFRALANRLYTGPLPPELQDLTVPEQLLVK
jgi:hypothetical protein